MIHPSHLFLLSIWKMTFEEQIVLGGGSYKRKNEFKYHKSGQIECNNVYYNKYILLLLIRLLFVEKNNDDTQNYLFKRLFDRSSVLFMSSDISVEDKELKDQIEETIKYLSFSVKQDTATTGTVLLVIVNHVQMGFKMQSRSGEDMSFVVKIDNTEDGVIGTTFLFFRSDVQLKESLVIR